MPSTAPVLAAGTASRARRPPRGGGGGHRWVALLFLAPAAVLLGAIVIYPTLGTVVRSFFDRGGSRFVGVDNYSTMFTNVRTLVAIRNNALWVIVFPFLVTFLGLVFAVLTERIRWGTAFKTILFMPMAISLFAAGVIWRLVYDANPHIGVLNAGIASVLDRVNPPGLYPEAKPISGVQTASGGGFVSKDTVAPGGTVLLGFTGIPPDLLPTDARHASPPQARGGAVSGVVWRDFLPGGGTAGVVDQGEFGLPAMKLSLLRSDGGVAAATSSQMDGSFAFSGVSGGPYRVRVDSSNFSGGFQGVDWLGAQSVAPTAAAAGETARAVLQIPLVVVMEIVVMLWMWSGFAMVVIGAGLAALDREVLEAARVDGASEWQTFRRVTFPLLMPVLIVVFVTMIINVLKIFDIVLAIAPGSSQEASNVIALEMWRTGFTAGDQGLASAVAVLLFLLVVPVMLLNVRRIRGR
jgi:alpha-glucoside transport system permease protein